MAEFYHSGCYICGEELEYFPEDKEFRCEICDSPFVTNVTCKNGHFVCDTCHSKDSIDYITELAKKASYSDMLEMMAAIRKHPPVPMHGPEHHFMVAAIILSVYKNRGGKLQDNDFDHVIDWAKTTRGGSCGFMGVCGAAAGAGVAFARIIGSSPMQSKFRSESINVVSNILHKISSLGAARCCQRDSYVALKSISQLSRDKFGIYLPADHSFICTQNSENKVCVKETCPLYSV